MAICTDSGCTTTNFDAIGRGSSYINSECIRANLAKAPEAVCIDSLEVRKKPGGHWIIRDLMGLDLVGLASL